MRRRRREPEAENHERWLVSYADFITLLFAFFVMMYANSKTDQTRAQQISSSFRSAMAEGSMTKAFARFMGMSPNAPPPEVIEEREKAENQSGPLEPSMDELREMLKKEIENGRVEVRLERRGLVISLREAAFFPSGNDLIDPSTLPVLKSIANELARMPNPIRLEGHTDSVPINTARFRSNWELSAARGISILSLFSAQYGIPLERMSISGFAETAPIAPNSTAEGRARNRRVDIVLLNEEAAFAEPKQSETSSD